MRPDEETVISSPRGATGRIRTRPDTSDLSIAGCALRVWGHTDDEYRLADLHVDGVFVDVGAHIGAVTLAVLLDNPAARAICVEPLAENCAAIAANMAANGLTERVTILRAAIAPGETASIDYGYDGSEYLRNHRYVGNIGASVDARSATTVPTVSLTRLVEWAGGAIDAIKLDCESCEWHALTEPAVSACRVIFGEWHGDKGGDIEDVRALLAATHDVESLADLGGTGIFRAVRR